MPERLSVSAQLVEKLKAEVESMQKGEVEAALAKIQAQRAKAREYYARPLTPEQKEKAKARAKEYMNRPEVKEKMRAYIQRPEVRERMKAKAKEKRERDKLILARASELGLA